MAARVGLGDPIEVTFGPPVGVFDSPDPGEASPRRLLDALNMLIPDLANASAAVARHGLQGVHLQLGDVASRVGQAVFFHSRLNGIRDVFVFAGGHFYKWDGFSSFTDLTPGGAIAIDSANPVFCASYDDKLVVSDERNKPWFYDPNTNTATLIEVDSLGTEWRTKGGPAIYDGKVFFILQARGESTLLTEDGMTLDTEGGVDLVTELLSGLQNTMVWSEELTPDVGYQQDNFSNFWVLTQSSSEVLSCLVGEEGSLVYFRNQGIGYITGSTNADFKGSATRDSISTTLGTDAPAAVTSINRRIWFVDMDGRVFRSVTGAGEPQQLWFPVRREIFDHLGSAANRADVVANARVTYHEGYNLVLFTIWDQQTIYAFDADSGIFVGTWSIAGDVAQGAFIHAMGSAIDGNNRATFLVLGTRANVNDTASGGVLWREKHKDDVNQWLDQPDESIATYVPLTRAVETHWLHSNACLQYRATDISATLVGDVARHQVGLEYVAPKSGKSNRIVALSTAGVGEKTVSDTLSMAQWSVGPNAQGIGLRFRISATHADNVRFGVDTLTVVGTSTKVAPVPR